MPIKKITGINWDKVDYQVKAYDMKYSVLNLNIGDEPIEVLVKRYKPKAWQLYFTLAYLLMVYTLVALTIPLLSTNGLTWSLAIVLLLVTPFFLGENFMAN